MPDKGEKNDPKSRPFFLPDFAEFLKDFSGILFLSLQKGCDLMHGESQRVESDNSKKPIPQRLNGIDATPEVQSWLQIAPETPHFFRRIPGRFGELVLGCMKTALSDPISLRKRLTRGILFDRYQCPMRFRRERRLNFTTLPSKL